MDTDYLTPMAYDCIRLANDATDVLKSEIGAACSQYRGEDAYLQGILKDVKEIEQDTEEYLDWWNLLDNTDMAEFRTKIRLLSEHIEKTLRTPIEKRGEPEFRL